jgi:hypothetical protein
LLKPPELSGDKFKAYLTEDRKDFAEIMVGKTDLM